MLVNVYVVSDVSSSHQWGEGGGRAISDFGIGCANLELRHETCQNSQVLSSLPSWDLEKSRDIPLR